MEEKRKASEADYKYIWVKIRKKKGLIGPLGKKEKKGQRDDDDDDDDDKDHVGILSSSIW